MMPESSGEAGNISDSTPHAPDDPPARCLGTSVLFPALNTDGEKAQGGRAAGVMTSVLLIPLVVALLIGVNALYVAGEFSSVSARRPRLAQMAEEGHSLARILLPILKDSHRLDNFIAASQVGITLSSIVLGIYGQETISPLITGWLLSWISSPETASAVGEAAAAGGVAVGVLLFLTMLQVIFGELLPKSIAIQYPEQVALATALPIRWSAEILLRPLIILLNGSGRLLLRLFRTKPDGEHSHIHSPEEIIILVQESHQSGLLDAGERRMLRSVFRVSELSAEEIAIPRTRMVTAEVSQPLEAVLRKMASSAFSRIPIYEKDIDQIIGFVHLRDLFNLYRSDPHGSLRTILRDLAYVPASLPVSEVWNQMNEADSYLAIVLDEYGGTGGLITREDVIEELFGERKMSLIRNQTSSARSRLGAWWCGVICRSPLSTTCWKLTYRMKAPIPWSA